MRSLLFVPADGGRKLDKALTCGADAVIVDLEDSIAPDRKDLARASAAAFLKEAVAKLTVQEAIAGLDDGHIKILAQALETAAGLFALGTLRSASARLMGVTWGPEDLSAEIGAETNRDEQGRLTEPYRLARALCL